MVFFAPSSLRFLALAVLLGGSISGALLTAEQEEDVQNALESAIDHVESMRDAFEETFRQTSLRGSAGKTEPPIKTPTSVEEALCQDEQFSELCILFNETKAIAGRSGNFVTFDINLAEEFTLFAPTNTAFTKPIVGVLPEEGLSLPDFLNTHIVDGVIRFNELSSNFCFFPIRTRNPGEYITPICDAKSNPKFIQGRGNTIGDLPSFIAFDLPAGRGIIHAIDNFIKPSQFIDNKTPAPSVAPSDDPIPSEAPSDAPSQIPSVSQSPSVSPSNLPSPAPSVSQSPSVSPSNLPSPTPSTLPTPSPSNVPSEVPTNRPTASPSESPSEVPSATPSSATTSSSSSSTSSSSSSSSSMVPSGIPSASATPTSVTTSSSSSSSSSTSSMVPSGIPSVTNPAGAFGSRVKSIARKKQAEGERKPRTIFNNREP